MMFCTFPCLALKNVHPPKGVLKLFVEGREGVWQIQMGLFKLSEGRLSESPIG